MTVSGFSNSARTAAFQRDGFVVLDGFLSKQELAPMRADADAMLAAPLPEGCERPHNTLAPLRWNDSMVQGVLASERRMRALASAIEAEDMRWISGYVSVKDARSQALWWHQDWWCWDHPVTYRRAAPQVAVLCYLTETNASNGALRVLPDSHRRSVALHAALPEAHAQQVDIDPGHVAISDHPGQVTLGVKAGDAIVADYRLLHGTHPNMSEQRRDCLLLSFTPSWRGLPTDIQGHLIRHPALPNESEWAEVLPGQRRLLPQFDGTPADLPLNRVAPDEFAMRA
jgi:Phytanoyl-CoA dioxygenase (PhyH)